MPLRACAAGLIVLMICWAMLYVPSLFHPSSCRELAERLQARGMDIRWRNNSYMYPSIWIVKKGSSADGLFSVIDEPDVHRHVRSWVIVTQYESATQAYEQAGTKKYGFSYGRFLIYGDQDLVDEIKRRL